jgi:hypothetical protein
VGKHRFVCPRFFSMPFFLALSEKICLWTLWQKSSQPMECSKLLAELHHIEPFIKK